MMEIAKKDYCLKEKHLYLLIRLIFAVGFWLSWMLIFIYIIFLQQFEIFAKVSISILAIFFTTASLFYNRARSLKDGSLKRRTLYAAERSTQASVLFLVGILCGGAIYCFSLVANLDVMPSGVIIENIRDFPGKKINSWVFLYFFPISFLMFGTISYYFSINAVLRDFVRFVNLKELVERSRGAP